MQVRLFYNGYAVKGTLLVDKRVCIKNDRKANCSYVGDMVLHIYRQG
jgi:hypothetical protein